MATKRIWGVLLGAAAVLLGAASCDDDERGGTEPTPQPATGYSHYMPLDLGNKWTYDVAISVKSAPAESHVYVYEVTAVKENYKNYGKAYVISIKKDGTAAGNIIAGCKDDACYVDRTTWLLLLKDTMELNAENETGLVWHAPFTYKEDEEVLCPAGTFNGCKYFYYQYAEVDNTTTAYEWYAKDVGLVKYYYDYEYRSIYMPHEPYDWGTTTYELKSYEIHHTGGK